MDTLLHDSLGAFFVHLERIHPMSSSLKETLKKCMVRECLPPRSLLLEEGEVCDRVYYVAKGLARGFYQVGKEEVTAWFVQGGDWMVSVSSFFDQKTSQESIELLEETVLLSIHYEDLNQIYQQSPEFNYIGR